MCYVSKLPQIIVSRHIVNILIIGMLYITPEALDSIREAVLWGSVVEMSFCVWLPAAAGIAELVVVLGGPVVLIWLLVLVGSDLLGELVLLVGLAEIVESVMSYVGLEVAAL